MSDLMGGLLQQLAEPVRRRVKQAIEASAVATSRAVGLAAALLTGAPVRPASELMMFFQAGSTLFSEVAL